MTEGPHAYQEGDVEALLVYRIIRGDVDVVGSRYWLRDMLAVPDTEITSHFAQLITTALLMLSTFPAINVSEQPDVRGGGEYVRLSPWVRGPAGRAMALFIPLDAAATPSNAQC